MLSVLKNRFEQGNKTSGYPRDRVELPHRYRGLPRFEKDAPEELAALRRFDPRRSFIGPPGKD